MPRPRKDGRPASRAIRIGRWRTTESGKRWAVRAYAPTPENPHGRVTFIRPGKARPTSAVPVQGETLDALFERIETALNRQVALAGDRPSPGTQRRDLEALGVLYVEWLNSKNSSDGYIANRQCILDKWITPMIGTVLVSEWSPEHSQKVLNNARAAVGKKRLNDIRSTLSGLRSTAHRKRTGGRWLDRTEDPLEEVTVNPCGGTQGVSPKFVPVNMRPSEESVGKALIAAAEVQTFPWMARAIRIGAFNAARLGEQLALRAIDVDFREAVLDVNGSWTVERKAGTARGSRRRWRKLNTKNGQRRETPFYESQREDLLIDCRRALGLPGDATEETVIALIEAERARRGRLTDTGDWRDYEADPTTEPWLFPDESGLPPTKERFNDEWHKVRDASGWDTQIPYKNLRHFAILRWKRLLGMEYEDIAPWSGHDHRTLEAYYRVPTEGAMKAARKRLAKL